MTSRRSSKSTRQTPVRRSAINAGRAARHRAPRRVARSLGTPTTDEAAGAIAGLPNLTRLHLNRTRMGDAGLARLGSLQQLEYLNLYGTRVTDAGSSTWRACES